MANLRCAKWFAGFGYWVAIILMLAGCGVFGRKFTLSDLKSPDPMVRIVAIKWAGDNKMLAAVPQLVDSLQDEDKSVRFYSIGALRRITGTDHGYDYKAAPHLQAAAVKRWRESLDPNELQDDEYQKERTREFNEHSD